MRAMAFVAAAVSVSAMVAAAKPPVDPAIGRIAGGVTSYVVSVGDSLRTLGSRFGVDPATIAVDNHLAANATLVPGQELRVDNRHIVPAGARAGLTINVPQRMLFYESDGVVVAMPVAVGQAGWRTPTQPFTVVRTETDPTWDVPASIREEARRASRDLPLSVPPGPGNPLGKYWLGLSIPSVGILGTNAPASIYRVMTHGCIRVGPEDIAWLFPRVAVGTPGRIVYEPILLAQVDLDILLEVHADVYRRLTAPPIEAVRALAQAAGLAEAIDWELARVVTTARHGIARSVGRAR